MTATRGSRAGAEGGQCFTLPNGENPGEGGTRKEASVWLALINRENPGRWARGTPAAQSPRRRHGKFGIAVLLTKVQSEMTHPTRADRTSSFSDDRYGTARSLRCSTSVVCGERLYPQHSPSKLCVPMKITIGWRRVTKRLPNPPPSTLHCCLGVTKIQHEDTRGSGDGDARTTRAGSAQTRDIRHVCMYAHDGISGARVQYERKQSCA